MLSYDKIVQNINLQLDLPFREGAGITALSVAKAHCPISHAGTPTLPAWASAISFVLGTTGGIAKYSSTKHHSGKHSACLSDGGMPTDWEEWEFGEGDIVFTMDILLADLVPADLSYWLWCSPPQTIPDYEHAFPYMYLSIDTSGGHVANASIVLHSGPAAVWEPAQGVWAQWNVGEYDVWHCGGDTRTLAAHQVAYPNARILNIGLELGQYAPIPPGMHDPITGYVDDICVNGVTYSIEPPVTRSTLASGLDVLTFDGVAEYLLGLAAATGTLNFTSGDYSIGCWFCKEASDDDNILLGKYGLNADGWDVYIDSTGHLRHRHHHTPDFDVCYSGGWNTGTWYFMGISRSGAFPLHYRNGVLLDMTYDPVGGMSNPDTAITRDLVIGTNSAKDSKFWVGKQWRPRIWNIALSANDWMQIYTRERHWFGV